MLRLITEDKNVEVVPVAKVDNDIDASLVKNACDESITSLIQKTWDYISEVNSIITTFDYDYKEADGNDIKEILNSVVDSATINIGMLHKVKDMLNQHSSNLVADGMEKAEQIISNSEEVKENK